LEKLKLQPFGLRAVADDIENILKSLEEPAGRLTLAQGQTLELGNRTLIMGILNVTPDSFSDAGKFIDPENAFSHA